MTLVVYGIKNCDACRKARRWLDQRQVDYRFHDVREHGLDANTVRTLVRQVGSNTLVNRRSTSWRSLPAAAREGLNDNRAVALLLAHPTLMKRPLLVRGDAAVAGFDEAVWNGFVQ